LGQAKRYVPSIPNFFRDFIIKGYWILSKPFSISFEMWCGFRPWFCLCVILHFLIYVCCTILASLKWNLLDHGVIF
jgi:hypothetical protein